VAVRSAATAQAGMVAGPRRPLPAWMVDGQGPLPAFGGANGTNGFARRGNILTHPW
jgi:hypothetical protein